MSRSICSRLFSHRKPRDVSLGNDAGISIQCNLPAGETIYGVTSYLSQTNISGGDAHPVNQRCTGPGGTFIPCPP